MTTAVYVAHDSGAEYLSCCCCSAVDDSGGLNSTQICALLSSFSLFEEELGLRTKVSRSDGGKCIQFGRRKPRTGLQCFAVLKDTSSPSAEWFLDLVEKLVDMTLSPLCLEESSGASLRTLSKKHPKSVELRRALLSAMDRLHGWREEATPSELVSSSLAATLRNVERQVSSSFAYCATAWVQDGYTGLAWTDEGALVPGGGGGDGYSRRTIDACVVTAAASGEGGEYSDDGLVYSAHSVYLGDEFLEEGQDPDAALCSLHVFKPAAKLGTELALAMVCEGAKAFDVKRNVEFLTYVKTVLRDLAREVHNQ
ncbi:hypothetical protein HOP50_04g28830 [Chloropicon primus]|uniref:Uncharacterized protein n=1 Tax=Chloropicon primus TaxID=1764295 RepID=A0A5B8MIP8_9CHLO|nr:hypothetical protein A3770_04p28840 [Chloropicon primus]UPQ99575.1 hypothetical protein HOP50_04g28830 [Chloropicon primus]|eukprot:QDZ20366.1 hypothetical protein A3770_04p28840 [Chloropicon primus]